MATKKPRPRGRAIAKRAKSTGARAAARKAKPTPKKKKTTARAAKPRKPATRSAKAVRSTPRAATEGREVIALKARFQRERSTFEKRLTEAVREIGLLRHHELRADHLERQLKEREELIARLQTQLAEIEQRPAEPTYDHEVQQSFALSTVPANELDEFEDENSLGEDGSLAEEDVEPL